MRQRIETLRDWAENRTMAPGDRSDLKWAIQELAHLEARVQELEEDIAGWKSDYNDVCEDCTKEENHRASLESENTRLREALAEYGHHKGGCDFAPCSCGILAALNEKPASVFGRDPMNAPDVTDILEEKP